MDVLWNIIKTCGDTPILIILVAINLSEDELTDLYRHHMHITATFALAGINNVTVKVVEYNDGRYSEVGSEAVLTRKLLE